MIPTLKNITIRRGDTKELFFRVRTKVWDDVELKFVPGPYKDLTGYTIESQVRESKSSPSTLLVFGVTVGNQADPESGLGSVLLKLTAAQTASVPIEITSGVFDVQFTEPDTDAFTYIEGTVTFMEDVTRD